MSRSNKLDPAGSSQLSDKWADTVAGDASNHDNLAADIEHLVERFQRELIPELKKARHQSAKLALCANILGGLIEYFDNYTTPPSGTQANSPEASKDAFANSMLTVAEMFELLYRKLKHCSFSEHNEILVLTREIVGEFYANATPELDKLELGPYNEGKLLLTLDMLLGADAPGGKHDRRRSWNKDPDLIEAALMNFLKAVIPLREHILLDDRKKRFDLLVIRVCEKLVPEPRGNKTSAGENETTTGGNKTTESNPQLERDLAMYEMVQAAEMRFRYYTLPNPVAQLRELVDKLSEKLNIERSERAGVPAKEDENAKGDRVNRAILATLEARKINKWMREARVDSDISAFDKSGFIAAFKKLSALAIGKDSSARDLTL